KNKKYGSKDRKWIREACFTYLRWGNTLSTYSIDDKIILGLWLKGMWEDDLPITLPEVKTTDFKSRFQVLSDIIKVEAIFPCIEEISTQVYSDEFILNHLVTPQVFFRITGKGT